MSACSKSRIEPNRQQAPFPNDRDNPRGGGDFPTDWLEGGNDEPGGGNDGLGSQGQPSQPTDPSAPRGPRIDCPLAAGQAGLATTTRRTALDDILPFSTDEPLHPPAGTPQRSPAVGSPCYQGTQPPAGQAAGSVPVLRPPAPPPQPQLVKVLFVVDKSFFNQISDRDGSLRTHFVRSIYDAHKNEGWYSYGMIFFEGDDAPGDEAEFHTCRRHNRSRCDGDPIFTTNHQIVGNAINFIQIGIDEGLQIRYRKALDFTEEIIKEDLEQPTQGGSHYAVFFMTGSSFRDGEYGYGHTDRNGQRFPADRLQRLYNKVQSIVGLGRRGYNNMVTFSTVYYGIEHHAGHYREDDRGVRTRNPDPPTIDPRVVLQEMARYGSGRYINIENNTPLTTPSVGNYTAPSTDQQNAYAIAPPAYPQQPPYNLDVTRNPNTLSRDNTFSETNIPTSTGFRVRWLEALERPQSGINWTAPSALGNPLEREDEPLVQWKYNFQRDRN